MMADEGCDQLVDILISYSNNDKTKVKRLVSELKQRVQKYGLMMSRYCQGMIS